MPPARSITVIFDIGKTNKKFLLFDEHFAVIEKHQTELEQAADDDGDPCEDLGKLETWIRNQIEKAEQRYQIKALNISAYGASLVHLGKNGKPIAPLYNYLKSYPKDLLSEFYESVGGKKEFSLQTASPPMGMLNSGLQLYWLKHQKPEMFQQVETSLHLPNYLSYLFSGEENSELTSIGCHTALWDFEKMAYHQWVKDEGVVKLLPTPQSVSKASGIFDGVKTGHGIHDSSAALVPYLVGMKEPFMLVSTGTWSIALNPFNDESLTFEELERDCLCYLDINGNQVKASRFFLGAEYAHQKKRIEDYFGSKVESDRLSLNVSVLNDLAKKNKSSRRLKLEKAFDSGPFPQEKSSGWDIDLFSSPGEAYHQLLLDLAAIQVESIKLAEGSKDVEKLIITGGFSQNKFFTYLLASFFPEKQVCTSSLPDASALGAAMVINDVSDNDMEKLLGLELIKPVEGLNLKNYSWV